MIHGFGLCGWLFGYCSLNGLKSTIMVKYKFQSFTRDFTVFLICTCFLLASVDRYIKKNGLLRVLYQEHVRDIPCCNFFFFQYKVCGKLFLLQIYYWSLRGRLARNLVQKVQLKHGKACTVFCVKTVPANFQLSLIFWPFFPFFKEI